MVKCNLKSSLLIYEGLIVFLKQRMNKLTHNRISLAQVSLTILVWLLLFSTPFLVGDYSNGINWNLISKVWKEYSVLFLIFLINRFVLIPKLFFQGKRRLYFISIISIILLFSTMLFFSQFILANRPRSLVNQRPPLREQVMPPPPSSNRAIPPPNRFQNPREIIPPFANLLVISILLIGFDSGLMFFSKWMKSEQIKLKVEKESIQNKMAFLQNQVSPHFFMNTLNNIHALIDISASEAKESIIKLSRMMDYMLYESQTNKNPVTHEMKFIKSYVDLMKLRIKDDVDLTLDIPDNLPDIKIPPLLTVAFIENAFKYGVSYKTPSFIHIQVEATPTYFSLSVKNSMHQRTEKRKSSGLGIENTRSRLELIYGKEYQLDIITKNSIFDVYLNVPV